jgi:hypothetical protein
MEAKTSSNWLFIPNKQVEAILALSKIKCKKCSSNQVPITFKAKTIHLTNCSLEKNKHQRMNLNPLTQTSFRRITIPLGQKALKYLLQIP